jgi:hypothetical protein
VKLHAVDRSFLHVYDHLGDEVLTDKGLVDAFSASWKADRWLGGPDVRQVATELWLASNDESEPLGLVLMMGAGVWVRASGSWHPCPAKSPWLNGATVQDVVPDFIEVYDGLERAGRLDLCVNLASDLQR